VMDARRKSNKPIYKCFLEGRWRGGWIRRLEERRSSENLVITRLPTKAHL
jgi:hypothetical protein